MQNCSIHMKLDLGFIALLVAASQNILYLKWSCLSMARHKPELAELVCEHLKNCIMLHLQGWFYLRKLLIQPPVVFGSLFAFAILQFLAKRKELLWLSVLRSDDCSSSFPSTEEQGQGHTARLEDLSEISNNPVIICVNTNGWSRLSLTQECHASHHEGISDPKPLWGFDAHESCDSINVPGPGLVLKV